MNTDFSWVNRGQDGSFNVRSGEILGIAGVSGNGQRDIAEAIAGLRPVEPGSSIELNGSDVTGNDTRTRRDQGLGFIPEERVPDGAIPEFTVSENLILVDHQTDEFVNRGLFSFDKISEHNSKLVSDFDVKTPNIVIQSTGFYAHRYTAHHDAEKRFELLEDILVI